MTTDLVPVDSMAAVEALPVEARELAVTQMLSEARSWLAHAVEVSGPQPIANFKAQMATVAEATKQLGLSKEIQMDAQEMVRRAERGVGLAIRKGQEEGTVQTKHEMKTRAGLIRQGTYQQGKNPLLPKPTDFAPSEDLTGNAAGIYHLTDGVSDERFDKALTTAKSEGNLSRANVVRQIKGEKPLGRPARKPLPEQVETAGVQLRTVAERVQALANDDRFTTHKQQVTPHLRSHLTFVIKVCQDVLDHINNT